MSQVPLTISMRAKEPSGLRLIVTLGLAGMLSGLALAGAYQITKPTIDANKARALERAVLEVVPGATAMEKLVWQEGRLVPPGEAETGVGDVVFAAYDEAHGFLAYAIEGEGPGFQDTIRLLFGFDPRRRQVIGMEVLQSRETPGLGDKIYKDEAFVGNFAALAIEPPIVLVKGGRSADNEVDAITGATISSKAVVRIINEAGARWWDLLPPDGPDAADTERPGAAPGEGR